MSGRLLLYYKISSRYVCLSLVHKHQIRIFHRMFSCCTRCKLYNGNESTKTGIGLSFFDVIETLRFVQSSCCARPLFRVCVCVFHPFFLVPLESRFSLFCEVFGCVSSPPIIFCCAHNIAISLIIANGRSEKSVRLKKKKKSKRNERAEK